MTPTSVDLSRWIAPAVFGAGLLLMLLMFVALNRRRAGRAKPAAPIADDVDDNLRELTADAGSLARRLDRLITEADERIAELKRLTGERPAAFDPSPEPAAAPIAERVYALADRGRNSLQIAQELHEHIGKVELILAIRKG